MLESNKDFEKNNIKDNNFHIDKNKKIIIK